MANPPFDPTDLTPSLWHLSTLSDYRRPAGKPSSAETTASSQLEDRLERLALICMAMWSLIQSETSLTEQDLMRRVKEIDLLDGSADGRITRQVTRCGQCRRPMSSRHTRCIYCGSENLAASAFDTV